MHELVPDVLEGRIEPGLVFEAPELCKTSQCGQIIYERIPARSQPYSAGMTSALRQCCSMCAATVDVVLRRGWLAVPVHGQERWPTPVTEQRDDPERAAANEPTAVVAGRWEHEGDTFVIRTRLRGQVAIGTAWARRGV